MPSIPATHEAPSWVISRFERKYQNLLIHEHEHLKNSKNAANEVAVEAFLQRRIGFTQIAQLCEQALQDLESHSADSLEQILADDRRAREFGQRWLERLAQSGIKAQ